MWRSRPRVEVPSLAEAEADPTAQRFRAGNIEIIATSGPGPQQGLSPVIEIDLNLRRRQRADTEPLREPEEDPPVEMVSQDSFRCSHPGVFHGFITVVLPL